MKMSLEQKLCQSILCGSQMITQINKLIADGADVNANHTSETACTRAIIMGIQGVTDAILYSSQCDVNAGNREERSPLYIAAEYGRLQVVKQLIQLGADINKPDYRKTTPLIAAIRVGHTNIARYLIEHGADLSCRTYTGETALYVACENVNVRVVELILAQNVDVNLQTNNLHIKTGRTPLMVALPSPYELEVKNRRKSDMLTIVRLLLSSGSDVNLVDDRGNTALHLATNVLDVHTVCVLADSGANLQIKNGFGETAFDIAMQKKADGFALAICLLLYGFRFDEKGHAQSVVKTLLSSVHPKDTAQYFLENTDLNQRLFLLQLLLKDIPRANEEFECYVPLENQNLQMIDLLKNSLFGVEPLTDKCRRVIRRNINSQLLKGITELPVAKCLKIFLSLDFDYTRNDPVSLCDLLLAIEEDNTEVASTLMHSGLNLDISIMDHTPLTYAATLGNAEMVELLLRNGANPMALDNYGNSALHGAAGAGSMDVLEILLENNCDINVVNSESETPLVTAALRGRFVAVQYLVDKGAECKLCNKNGRYVIHYAAASGHLSACKILVNKGVSVNQTDDNGNTPLHLAASCGFLYTGNNIDLPALFPSEAAMHMDGIRQALGNKPSKVYYSQNKIRTLAIRHGDVVRLLLRADADNSVLNIDGKTPLDVALEFGHSEIVDILNITQPTKVTHEL